MEFDFEWQRIIISFLAGYFLSISGSLSQVVTQNHLASPSTLGFDGLAVLIILVVQSFLTFWGLNYPLEHLSFFLFSLLFGFIVFYTFTRNRKMLDKGFLLASDIKFIILMGLGFNLFVAAVFSVVQFLFMAMSIEFPSGIWFGNFRFYDGTFLSIFIGAFILNKLILSKVIPSLRLMGVSSEFAFGLGMDIKKTQRLAIFLSLFLTGLVISYFGVFSFLGLIFPHILRSFDVFKYNLKKELLIGPYVAGVFLSGMDFLCYNFIFYGAELPVGMVTSVVGSLLLLTLLVRTKLMRSNY